MKRLLSAVGAGAAVLIALSGCSSAPETPAPAPAETEAPAEIADLDALVEAAKAEGALSVYSQLPEPSMVAFVDAFKEKYGIQVDALRLGGNTLAARFDAEIAAGTPTADMVIQVDIEYMKNQAAAGNMLSFSDTGVADYLEGFPEAAVFEGYDAPQVQVVDVGFIYNTDSVKAKDVPESWKDLSSSRWAGKYCAVDPATSLNVGHFFWKLREVEGEDAVVEFGKNIGRWYPNVIAMNEAVAVGECELGVGSAKFFVAQAKETGAAVDFASQPLSIRPITSAAIATKALHPNAAKLFLYFILSEEGNKLLNDPEVGSLGPWDVDLLPEDFFVPTPEEFQSVRDENADIIALLA